MKFFQSTVEKLLYLLLGLVITVVVVFAFNVSVRTKRNHDLLVSGCSSGNEFRVAEKKLWGYILGIPPSKPLTKAQQQQVNDFKVFLDKTFAERDCSHL